jgi:capsular exopolysaccharide synthesis family protein
VEAFRVLRTNLQFVNVDSPSKVFVVTSSLPEEGKTTTSCNLAVALAQAGQRVLLLEGDLRRPKISEHLNVEEAVGLTTVLVGRIGLADAVQPSGVPGLDVLPSGATPPNPSELLQSNAMHDVMDRLRKDYDVIVVDAPPLLPVTDAALLTAQSDGALLVIRHGKTTKDQVQHAAERLEAVDGRLVGAVLNMVPRRRSGDTYYGYGYGYAPERGRRHVEADDNQDGETSALDRIGLGGR